MNRREALYRLGGGLLALSLPRLARAEPEVCGIDGPTIGAVTGPFPPPDFHPILRGAANPGPRLAVGENDMDLAHVAGAAAEVARGQVVRIRGQLITAGCAPLVGASVLLWQADESGNYNHENERSKVGADDLDPGFGYWGSATTDAEGRFEVLTIVPGAYPAGRGWWRPPHLHWTLRAEGLPEVTTQSYFDGDVISEVSKIRQLNADDLILNIREGFAGAHAEAALAEARRRALEELVVNFTPDADGVPAGSITFRLG